MTLRDVARHAGLSVTQTSRALNGHDDVAEATKLAVQVAADEIGYTPNLGARRLKVPQELSHALGLVLPAGRLRLSDPFFSVFLAGLVEGATKANRQLHLSTALADADEFEPYRRLLRHRNVDGLVLVRTLVDDPRVAFLQNSKVPFVSFGRVQGADSVPFVDDADDAMKPVVDHLVGLGHRRIACISEPGIFVRAASRRASFVSSMRSAGLEIVPELMIEVDFDEESGRKASHQLLSLADRPTAIVAANDQLALGAIRAANELSISVPSELSVTGHDDILLSQLSAPSLTTLKVPAADIGAMLCGQLIALTTGEEVENSEIWLRPELVERDSTGPVFS